MAGECQWDAVVVGAGVMGSATAYFLARNGMRTLLLEQFPLGHVRGSSHGPSRITRHLYKQAHYTQMMFESFRLWDELERESGKTVYTRTGCLVVGPSSVAGVHEVADAARKWNVEHERLSRADLACRFPQFSFPDDYIGVFEKEAGMLNADAGVAMLQSLFCNRGGVIRAEEPVVRIDRGQSTSDPVTVHTTKGSHVCRKVVLTPGAWVNNLLQHVGLALDVQVLQIAVCYWEALNAAEYSAPHFPCVIDYSSDHTYALPALEYPGLVKICAHYGTEVTANTRTSEPNSLVVGDIADSVRRNWRRIRYDNGPAKTVTCLYTMTPDEEFVLDKHPDDPRVVVGAGFSGHGFKLAPVVGRILADMCLDRPSGYDLSPCAISKTARRVPVPAPSHL